MENSAFPFTKPGRQPPLTSVTPDMLDSLLNLWGESGQMQWLSISGRSMLPLMRDGDRILVEFRPRALKPGDVLLFRQNELLVAHRLLRLTGQGDQPLVIAKGDNVAAFDPPYPLEDVIGRVHAIRSEDREHSLDIRAWRIAGRAIAGVASSLAWAYGGGQTSFTARGVRKLAQWSIRGLVGACLFMERPEKAALS